ncbi:hypothetical protein MFUL124B02_36480 [Myxococcus fulvus 124B02]|nr:hypothetical protein MFUL124B02_36480 [Myxococcus fulvus 124B02]
MSFIGTKKFPRSLQLDSWSCGSRAVHAVLRHFGVHWPHRLLQAHLGTNPDTGTAVHQMIRVLRGHALRVGYHAHLSWLELGHALNAGAVVIVHLDGDHLGVAHGVDDEHVYLADPSTTRLLGRRQTRQKFLSRWTRWGLVVRRSATKASRRS